MVTLQTVKPEAAAGKKCPYCGVATCWSRYDDPPPWNQGGAYCSAAHFFAHARERGRWADLEPAR